MHQFTRQGNVSVDLNCSNARGNEYRSTYVLVQVDLDAALDITVDYTPDAVPLGMFNDVMYEAFWSSVQVTVIFKVIFVIKYISALIWSGCIECIAKFAPFAV